MTGLHRRRGLLPALSLLALAACGRGDGSDLGPRLPRLPDASMKVLLFDDDNRGVVSATVAIPGEGVSALTGRNGRGDFLAGPRGQLLFDVDPTWGAAANGDTLGGYRVAMSVTGSDVPAPLHVPDLPDASSASVSAGVQVAATTLTTATGNALTVPVGTSIGGAGSAAQLRLSLGELAAEHLPGDLPGGSLGARLFGRGFYVGPVDATFMPGIDLDVDDDLRITTPDAQLFRLDDQTGEWSSLVPPVFATATGGRLQLTGAITRGGLYAFGVDVDERAVQGRVVDAEGRPVFEAMVTIDQRRARTEGNGEFLIEGVAKTFGDGSPRDAVLEVYAGATWLPTVATGIAPYSAATVDVLDDVVLDTVRAGNVRVQQVVRARADVFQPARLSSLRGDVALAYASDAAGQVLFEDVPAGFFGFQEGRKRDFREAFYGQQVTFLGEGNRWLDIYQFLFDRPWFQGSGSCRGYVSDSVGGGPVEFAAVVQGDVADEGYLGETRDSGQLFADRRFNERATASVRTARDGYAITHAFTVERPDSDHLELPLRRVLRRPLGNFERHGTLLGEVAAVAAGAEYETRVTRRITRQELWDRVFDGAQTSSYPVDAAVAATSPAFRVGLPVAGGNLSIVELSEQGDVDVLQRAVVLADVRDGLVEGAPLLLAERLELVAADQPYRLADALINAPAELDAAALGLSLGQAVPGAGIVDVARAIDGSVAVAGDDLQVSLPPLDPGQQWVLLLDGETSAGGVASSHRSMVDVAAATTAGFSFREFPALTGPAPGATVSADGFEVEFSLPAGCVAGKVQLRSATADDLLLWEVLVRPDQSGFAFVTLPVEAETPLVAGRTYTLTVSAWFGTIDIDSPDLFADFVAFSQSIAPIEAGIRQVTSRSIEVTTN